MFRQSGHQFSAENATKSGILSALQFDRIGARSNDSGKILIHHPGPLRVPA
jgi:hypothetical protein